LRARKLRWDELSLELPSKAEHEVRKWRIALGSAASWRWRLARADAANCRGPIAGSAARSLVPVAPLAVLTPEPITEGQVSPEGKAKLPVPVSSYSVIRWSIGEFARSGIESKAASADRSAASAKQSSSRRWRAAERLVSISCGILAGLTLGIVASSGALFTGFKLGEAVVQANQLLRPHSASEPPTSPTSDNAQLALWAINPEVGVSSSSTAKKGEIGLAPAVMKSSPADGAATTGGLQDASPAQAASSSAASASPTTGLEGDREGSTSAGASAAEEPPSGSSWAALYARGHRAQSEGDLPAATNWYQEAVKLNPNHPAILYDLGYMLQVHGDIDGAIEKYRKVIELDPNHAYAQYDLGFLLQKKGDNEGAVVQYKKAAKLNPGNAYVYFDWAQILERENDLAGAKALYERASELAPQARPGTDARRRLAALNDGNGR
jgi:tetratricopeptide (TPR) repeat protein